MVSLDTVQADSARLPIIINEPTSSPRISFSAEFLDDSFITISPNNPRPAAGAGDFEFLSGANSLSSGGAMIGADELFFEGKLLPFWHSHHAQKLSKINLNDDNGTAKPSQNDDVPDKEIKPAMDAEENKAVIGTSSGGGSGTTSWFMDDDPSPRPPKCTVLWKELLRLKKQRSASGLSPSSSTSSSSSSNSVLDSAAESRHAKHHSSKGSSAAAAAAAARRGLERTRSATIRIRPMINVPICTQVKTSVVATSHYALPPLFPLKKGKLER